MAKENVDLHVLRGPVRWNIPLGFCHTLHQNYQTLVRHGAPEPSLELPCSNYGRSMDKMESVMGSMNGVACNKGVYEAFPNHDSHPSLLITEQLWTALPK